MAESREVGTGRTGPVGPVGPVCPVGPVHTGLEARPGPGPGPGPATELASRARSAARASGRRSVILVDGRSGTGKTTLGNALGDELRCRVVHLDDLYPGWDGLADAAEAVVRDVLGPPSGYRRWDWETSAPAAWVSLEPGAPLVIEGCGSLSRASAPFATLRVWMTAEDGLRKRRALDRDGAVFAAEWERWALQEDAFIAAEDPRASADVVLGT
ncbi:ATP-binding protein [Curtobacterium sp. PhB136]|uniref:ATP-binding protein n=1 Tax=Curtobacterium sp. PhB136 TaxID=2485181 RepID=UPI0010DD0736|nr:ATP-binding protein [Curtobacterium sp. PhB136]TCK63446.1 hypothetical protein EDF27_1989 [Curtobacterium sp. PhB136]